MPGARGGALLTAVTNARDLLHEIVFETNTRRGRAFDVLLLVLILGSVAAIALESVPGIAERHGETLRIAEWAFTGVFTVEYGLRVYCARRRFGYVRSFFGLVDLVSILPAFLSLVLVDAHGLATVRVLRLVRIFRVLKLVHFLGEASALRNALRASLPKITVFLVTVLCLVIVVGSVMHVVEGPANGFDSIPRGVYWAVVTLTTVGYGDIAPKTVPGQFLASFVMLIGYGILAVPTGIVSAELVRQPRVVPAARQCCECGTDLLAAEARFCSRCGAEQRAGSA